MFCYYVKNHQVIPKFLHNTKEVTFHCSTSRSKHLQNNISHHQKTLRLLIQDAFLSQNKNKQILLNNIHQIYKHTPQQFITEFTKTQTLINLKLSNVLKNKHKDKIKLSLLKK